ncbi:MAG: HK97 gp10 family phage protein [Clostridia bacterium]|nr:HK97 gp10 family phage protein [Clostridia bacterium]
MRITVKVKGTRELRRALEKLGKRTLVEAGKALYAEAELIMTESKKQCPVDTGTLKSTGYVEQPKYSGGQVTVQMGYGGPAAPYAVIVHEGYGPHAITAKNAKVLAAPANKWKGGPVNEYESKQLPKYSKDGNYVILGKTVHHPGFAGKKYLENPVNEAAPQLAARLTRRLRQVFE